MKMIQNKAQTIKHFQDEVAALGYKKRTAEFYFYNQDYEYTQYWTHPSGAEIELYHDGSDTLPPKALCYNKSSLSRAKFKIDLHEYRLEAEKKANQSVRGLRVFGEFFDGRDWIFCMCRSKYGANLAYWNAKDFAPETYEKLKPRIAEFYDGPNRYIP